MNEKQKVTIIVNGKEYEVEMWHNEVKRVIAAAEHGPLTGYEKIEEEGSYYYIDECDDISENSSDCYLANVHYDSANYYSNRNVAANNQRADTLMREVRRFAAMNGGVVAPSQLLEEEQIQENNYVITCVNNKTLLCCEMSSYDNYPHFGLILFRSKEGCRKCIEVFHDELLWYFTEYQPQLYEED